MTKPKEKTTTTMNLKDIPKKLGADFKEACKRGGSNMTAVLKYYMELVVVLEKKVKPNANPLLPQKEEGTPDA